WSEPMTQSRIPEFYKFSVANRLRVLYERGAIDEHEYHMLMDGKQLLDADKADRLVENVIGTFSLPMGLGLNFLVNGRDYLVPMVVEEPSIIAAVSSAAKLMRAGGGIRAQADAPMLIGQIQVVDVPHPAKAQQAIAARSEEITNLANSLHPKMVARGGGAREVEVRLHSSPAEHGDMLIVHLIVDTRDAMGANLVNTMCEGVAPLIEKICHGKVFLRILSNLTDRAMVRARTTIALDALGNGSFSGEQVRDGVILATEFAALDPYRATTHNKGVMNGIDPVAIATGNDWRAIESAAHAYAGRGERYTSLTRWYSSDEGDLVGEIELPLKVGTIGGQMQSNQAVLIAHRLLGIESAPELAGVMAAVGLAANFSALRALSTDGIQRGHMTLHARSVAIAAGAQERQFDTVVEQLIDCGDIKVWKAREIIERINAEPAAQPEETESTTFTADQVEDGSGYAKIILLGEHSVVYHRHAIAAPIPLTIRAEVRRQESGISLIIPRWGVEQTLREVTDKDNSLLRSMDLILRRLGVREQPMRVEVFPHVPRSVGLGASAALAVAVIRGVAECFQIAIDDEQVNDLAYQCEEIAHGTPSGIDNTLATFGRPIVFRKGADGKAPMMREIHAPQPIPVVIGLSGVRTLTAETVGRVRAAWQANPERYEAIFSQIDELALAGIEAIEAGNLPALGELMNIDQGLLNALQVSCWEIEELVQIARANGALGAKLTGGGGGGAVIAIAQEDRTEGIALAMRRAGYDTFITEVR
ncbi:MAG: hydroxymethylglutaryl-CoA reductase, degradative, partial [Salinisphaera sp.]|nr:hydroxymethylglutaryl-CoA reductase, degradative [Salinisphaera sp.]